jgi:hypothetical protein
MPESRFPLLTERSELTWAEVLLTFDQQVGVSLGNGENSFAVKSSVASRGVSLDRPRREPCYSA